MRIYRDSEGNLNNSKKGEEIAQIPEGFATLWNMVNDLFWGTGKTDAINLVHQEMLAVIDDYQELYCLPEDREQKMQYLREQPKERLMRLVKIKSVLCYDEDLRKASKEELIKKILFPH